MKKTVIRRLRDAAHLLYGCAEEMRANERVYSEDDFDRLDGLAGEAEDMADRASAAVRWPFADGACSECEGSGDGATTASDCALCHGTGREPQEGG